MPPFRHSLRRLGISIALGSAALLLMAPGILLPNAARTEPANAQENPPVSHPQEPQPPQPHAAPSREPPVSATSLAANMSNATRWEACVKCHVVIPHEPAAGRPVVSLGRRSCFDGRQFAYNNPSMLKCYTP
jgi:hypothetical protein